MPVHSTNMFNIDSNIVQSPASQNSFAVHWFPGSLSIIYGIMASCVSYIKNTTVLDNIFHVQDLRRIIGHSTVIFGMSTLKS
jgi:hypothetical protein